MQVNPILKQTPYLGTTPHLIDCIFIFGYYPDQKDHLLKHYTTYLKQNPPELKHRLLNTIKPTLLSSIYSPYSTSQVQYDITLNVLAPSFIPPFPISSPKPPEPSNIIFFRNFYDDETQTNIVRYGFGYVFYEKHNEHYFPKILGFITKYPCYNMLSNISKNIVNYINKQTIMIPLEVILYNIVNYIPPPIHSAIKLDINYKECDLMLLSNNYIMSQISGYPYFDIKVMEIFKIISVELLIKIVTFSFLEETILIFSSNLEILNIVLYIISNLSYPLVDTNYLWHIISCGIHDLKGETYNTVLNQSATKITGIHCSYSDFSEELHTLSESFFTVDLEKGNMVYHTEIKNSVPAIMDYLDSILADKTTNLSSENVVIEKAVKILNFSLGLLSRTYLNKFEGESQKKPMFFSNEITEETVLENKELMNAFYKYIITICLESYVKMQCDYKTEEELSFHNNIIEETNIKEEEYFFTKMRENSKYELFFRNFIQKGKIYDSLRIPYTFIEEFMNYKKMNKDVAFESKLLDMIDYLYFNGKDNEENNSDTNITEISFNKLYSFYKETFSSSYIFLVDSTSYVLEKQSNSNINYIFKYDNFDIDLQIVFHYAHFLENINESQLNQIITSIPIIKQSPYKEIKALDICNLIEKFAIDNELIDTQHLIVFSKLNLILSLGNISTIYNNIFSVIQVLASLKLNIRKYTNMFLEICNSNINNNQSLGICNELIKVLTIGNIMPNAHLFALFNELKIKNVKLNKEENLLRYGINQDDKIYSIQVNEHFDKIYSKNEKLVFIYGDISFFDMFFEEVDEEIKEKFITLTFRQSGQKETIALMSPKDLNEKVNEIYEGYYEGKVKKKEYQKSRKEFMDILGNMIFFCEYLWDKEYFNFNFLVEYVLSLPE